MSHIIRTGGVSISHYEHWKGQIHLLNLFCSGRMNTPLRLGKKHIGYTGYYVSIEKKRWRILSGVHNIWSLEPSGGGKAITECPVFAVCSRKLPSLMLRVVATVPSEGSSAACSILSCWLLCFSIFLLILIPMLSTPLWFVFSLNQAAYLFSLQLRALAVRSLRDIINRMGERKYS